MGIDYYSYIVAGVFVDKCISQIEYEEKTQSYVEIKGKRENIYFKNGKPIFNVRHKMKWIFNNQTFDDWYELENALDLLGLILITQVNENEIWEGDVMGLIISECKHNVILDFDTMIDKLTKSGDILKSIGIDEAPQIINILHISY